MSEITRQIAKMIDGRQYRNEVTKEIIELAKNNNIVIVFRASDDLVEFRGAIYGEVEGEALWCKTFSNCSCTYKTTIPHETFCIWEDNEQYCIGIVFSLDELLREG